MPIPSCQKPSKCLPPESSKVVEVLCHLFASYGLPKQIVSDNGPQFLRLNGVRHIRCAPYHPSSNGAVEMFVRTFKEAMKAGVVDGRSSHHQFPANIPVYSSCNNSLYTLSRSKYPYTTGFTETRPQTEHLPETSQTEAMTWLPCKAATILCWSGCNGEELPTSTHLDTWHSDTTVGTSVLLSQCSGWHAVELKTYRSPPRQSWDTTWFISRK